MDLVKRMFTFKRSMKNRPTPAENSALESLSAPKVHHESQWGELKKWGMFNPYPNSSSAVLMLLLGSGGVGKTSLRYQLMYGDMEGGQKRLQALYDPTGIDETQRFLCGHYAFDMEITNELNSFHSRLQIFDSFGVALAYEARSRESWNYVVRIYAALRREFGDIEGLPFPVMLLRLKADILDGQEAISREEADRFSNQAGCRFMECSAATGEGVHQVFEYFIQQAYASCLPPNIEPSGVVNRHGKEKTGAAIQRALVALETLATGPDPGSDGAGARV